MIHKIVSVCALGFLLSTVPLSGQGCQTPTDTFWRRDSLPVVPAGLTAVSLVRGICENESAGVVFTLPPGMPIQQVTQVVAPWGPAGGVNGQTALLDVEIYDGVSFTPGNPIPNMGTLVFRLSNAGANMSVSSHALNTLDVSAFNIIVGQQPPNGVPLARRYAVCFTVLMNNYTGVNNTCATGYDANFFTDNAAFSFSCNGITTPQQTSLIEITGQGWRDAALAMVSGVNLCPFFYSGVFCIRACTRNAAPPNPFQVNPLSPLPANAPSTIILQLVAPGLVGYPYIMGAALATSPGIPTPFGTIPLANDALLAVSLDPAFSSIFLNFQGTIGSGGTGTALINLPAGLGPLTFYVAWVAVPPSGPLAISDPLLIPVL